MAGKSDAFETAYLNLIFNNQAIANIGDAGGLQSSATAGSLYVSLHTADPGEAGTQTTSETAYTGYARKAVTRGTFPVAGNTVTLPADQDFGECTASPGAAVTHFAIGVASTGAGLVLYSGPITPTITMAVGVIPRVQAATNVTED